MQARKYFYIFICLIVATITHAQCHPISAVPITISQPGTWCLTTDLTTAGFGSAITVATSNVTVDLSGYFLNVTSFATGLSAVGAYNGITVRNGRISAGYRAIDIRNANAAPPPVNVLLEQLRVDGASNTAINVVGNTVRIADTVVAAPTSSTAYGIYASGRNVEIDHVSVNDAYWHGVSLAGGPSTSIRNSTIYGTVYPLMLSGDGTVAGCEIASGGTLGLYIASGNVNVIGNRITASSNPIFYNGGSTGKYRDNFFQNGTQVIGGTDAGNNN